LFAHGSYLECLPRGSLFGVLGTLRRRASIKLITQSCGHRVRGYMSPGPRSTPHTLELVAKAGFDWICEYVDCDFPYVITVLDRKITAISYGTPGLIDYDLMNRGPVQALADMKYTFDAAYAESNHHPMKFCYAVHTHWGGTVGMARMLDDFLSHVRAARVRAKAHAAAREGW